MSIPFLDVGSTYLELKSEIDTAIQDVLDSGWYIGGRQVQAFEEAFSGFCSADYCIGVGNGLDAISLILEALEIGMGDEVIVPAHTFIATWLAVSNRGAKIIPIEPDPVSWNIDPSRIEQAVTARTKAIIVVHLYGQPADLDPIIDCASRHGLKIIEDAAQAHGARYRGRNIGAHGDAVAWSFYPGKNLGAFGDAGGVTTNDQDLAQKVRRIANYGSIHKYVHEDIGRNSRLDPLQAAVLSIKLTRLDQWNARREDVARLYHKRLKSTGLILPEVISNAQSAWHLFVIATERRDSLRDTLSNAGVQTVVHYPTPPHLQPAYSSLGYGSGSFPISEYLAQSVLSLPIGPHLSFQNADLICDIICDWADGKPTG